MNGWEGRLSDIDPTKNRAFLVGSYFSSKGKFLEENDLKELDSLAYTYGLQTSGSLLVHLHRVDPGFYVGRGKVDEIALLARENGCTMVIFDEELSPQQQKNLEEVLQVPVIDRTELILGVFSQRAKTSEAKIQVELAQCEYQYPRLKRLWTHLSRQKTGGGGGGGGYLKGEGERQIEIDRRIVKTKMHRLKRELKDVMAHREVQRKARTRQKIPSFAIVGYTNVGKSTLFHALTEANILIEDKLFATLDPTVRKYTLPNHQDILLVDTVGFIRKLPHSVVAAFRSTLEEALYADILIHVIDMSSPYAEEQAKATYKVLEELEASKRSIITCLNKADLCADRSVAYRLRFQYPKVVEISALEKSGFDHLLEIMMDEIQSLRKVVRLRVPQKEYHFVSRLMREGRVISCDYEENDVLLRVEIPLQLEGVLKPYLIL